MSDLGKLLEKEKRKKGGLRAMLQAYNNDSLAGHLSESTGKHISAPVRPSSFILIHGSPCPNPLPHIHPGHPHAYPRAARLSPGQGKSLRPRATRDGEGDLS